MRFPNWETYGKAIQGMANDPAFQSLMAEALKIAQVADRAVVVGIDL
jgi:hypothetical protein